MLGAFTLAGLLLQLAVHSDALSMSQSLGPLEDDDALVKRGDKGVGQEDDEGVGKEDDAGGVFVYDVDEDTHWNQAADSNSLITDIDSNLQPARPALDPDEKARQLAAKFVTQFVSEMDVSRARDTGELLGMQLCMMEEFNPPKVCKVKKWGLVNDWNEAQLKQGQPDKQILVGDEISKVNQIEWHHNSKMFAKRISDQFMNSRKKGGRDTIELHIRRPQPDEVPDKRSELQRQDRHKFLYAKEWTPTMFTTVLKKDWPWTRKPNEQWESDSMGWTLDHPKVWKPVTISSIKPQGFVYNWNMAHQQQKIVVGDELVQVDGYTWKHNSTLFMERITYIMHHVFSDGKVLKLGLRRPREVQEALDNAEKEKAERDHPRGQAKEDDDGVVGAGGSSEEGAPGAAEREQPHVQAKRAEEAKEDDDGVVGGGGSSEADEAPPKAEKARKAEEDDDGMVGGGGSSEADEAPPKAEGPPIDEKPEKPPARADREESYKASGGAEGGEAAAEASQETEVISCSRTFHVRLHVPKGSLAPHSGAMGWMLGSTSEAPARVNKIRDQGAVAEWNAENPEKIEVGDLILSVGNVSSKEDPESFVFEVGRLIGSLAKGELQAPSVNVEVQRSWNETRSKAQFGQQKVLGGSSIAGALLGNKEGPATSEAETIASIKSKMDEIAHELSTLNSEDSIALASELFSKALTSSVAASIRNAQHDD